jgi:amidohydrolase
MIEKIKLLASEMKPMLSEIRRHLHKNPEISFFEFKTGRYIADILKKWGIEFKDGVAGTGVSAKIYGKDPESRTIALRADIDALPIMEVNDCDYKSQNDGVMHACGHDAHTASLLGTAYILHKLREEWSGTIQLIFQPGEEKLPGGASLVLSEGWLNNPKPAYMLGQHVEADMEVGKIGLRSGIFMASADEIYITVKGKGGHGARPNLCIDSILLASNLIVSLQQIVSRRADPIMPSVLTFGKIHSNGGATNIIPTEVLIEGTFRSFNEKWRFEAHKMIKEMSEMLCSAMGGSCEVRIEVGYPFLKNNDILTAEVKKAAQLYLGNENVLELPPRMGAEDFAFYSQAMPTSFYRLGTKNPNGTGLHTPSFDIDENALEIGAGLMTWLAISDLGK